MRQFRLLVLGLLLLLSLKHAFGQSSTRARITERRLSPGLELPNDLSEEEEEAFQKYTGYRGLRYDGFRWQFALKKRLVIVGDIHGDINALLSILVNAKLIEREGDEIRWSGGSDTQLVIMGDVVAKGDHSADVLNLLIHIEKLCKEAGSEFHFVLGNHELDVLRGDFSKLSKEDVKNLEKIGPLEWLFSADGPYGQFLAKKNAILKIGKFFFFHKGFREWILLFTPGVINATIRGWINYWISGNDKPPAAASWAVQRKEPGLKGDGPTYSAGLTAKADSSDDSRLIEKSILLRWFAKWNAAMGFMAHYVRPKGTHLMHPVFGSLIYTMDTGNSAAIENGRITYLNVVNGLVPTARIHIERSEHKHPFRKAGCLARLEAEMIDATSNQ